VNIVYFLLPLALLLGGGFALSFALAALKGQYDDLETPAHRVLIDDEPENHKERNSSKTRKGLRS
jgi:cbb3-type cytochrome oxidase maturation protein